MDDETLRILCATACASCKVELDGQTAVNTDKLPGVLLQLIDSYMMGTSYKSHQERHKTKEPDSYCPVCGWAMSISFGQNGEMILASCECGYRWSKTESEAV